MVKILKDRVKAGVDVRIIGKVNKSASEVPHERYPGKRLHRPRHRSRPPRSVRGKSEPQEAQSSTIGERWGIIVKNQTDRRASWRRRPEEDWALTDSGKKDKRKEADQAGEAARRSLTVISSFHPKSLFAGNRRGAEPISRSFHDRRACPSVRPAGRHDSSS